MRERSARAFASHARDFAHGLKTRLPHLTGRGTERWQKYQDELLGFCEVMPHRASVQGLCDKSCWRFSDSRWILQRQTDTGIGAGTASDAGLGCRNGGEFVWDKLEGPVGIAPPVPAWQNPNIHDPRVALMVRLKKWRGPGSNEPLRDRL